MKIDKKMLISVANVSILFQMVVLGVVGQAPEYKGIAIIMLFPVVFYGLFLSFYEIYGQNR